VTGEMKRDLKRRSCGLIKYYPSIRVERLMKAMENLRQDGRCSGRHARSLPSNQLGLIDREIGDISIDWAQMCRFLSEEGDRIQSPKRCVLNKKTGR
jgi:hypothetical protein